MRYYENLENSFHMNKQSEFCDQFENQKQAELARAIERLGITILLAETRLFTNSQHKR